MNQKLLIHTASLYYFFKDYEAHLEDRIRIALDAGLDGVEISNGPSILNWQPSVGIISRLQDKTVTLHAEIGPAFGCDLRTWVDAVSKLPFEISNAVFHPDELQPAEFSELPKLPFPASLENLDSRAPQWGKVNQLNHYGVPITFDTAHAEENKYTPPKDFEPIEVHLSIANDNYYNSFATRHALVHFRPDRLPYVPRSSLITLEGVFPPDVKYLDREISYVKKELGVYCYA